MTELNQELKNLSKSLAGVSVSKVLQKHGIGQDSGVNDLSESQKQELRNIAQNLETMVNEYVAQQNDSNSSSQSEGGEKDSEPKESPLREFLKRKKEKEVDG
ncbi:hypothetical protein GWK91_15510 [Virgibacillus sp. MSP4-1]|uniref:hypothetical protein n=1 Tax=Virgibacillus sp. MSP4-1 TaxID=2700081 RepID=UPI00039C4578|nr:hypothetical protein [Virgibacillus sp. MSP4-1]QHS24217.1 hypothetical protein GWK91_15510 [Virgibacillus sp. MSP4-1]